MTKAAPTRARTDPEPKPAAKNVCGKIRQSAVEAFRAVSYTLGVMLYRRVLYPRRIPNRETIAVLREMDAGIGVTKFESPEDFQRELDRA